MLLRNASYNSLAQLGSQFISFIFVPIYLYFLGLEAFGIYSFIIMMFGWIVTVQAGIDPAVIRMTSQFLRNKTVANISSLISSAILLQFVLATIICLTVFLFKEPLSVFFVKKEVQLLQETQTALVLAGINIIALMSRNVYVSLFRGMQRYDIVAIFEFSFNLIVSLLSLIVLIHGYGIKGMICVRLVLNSFSLLALCLLAKSVLPQLKFFVKLSSSMIFAIYKYSSWIFLSRMNRLAVQAIPPIMIGIYIGPSGIAYFKIATTFVSALNNLLASAISVIFPLVSELQAAGNLKKVKSLYRESNRLLSYISAPLFAFGIINAWNILAVWVGKDIADEISYLVVLFFAGYYLSSATMVPANFSLGLGHTKVLAFGGFIQTIIVLVSLPFLLDNYGIVGAGYNLIAFEISAVVTGIYITKKYVDDSVAGFWLQDRIPQLVASLTIYFMLHQITSWFFLNEGSKIFLFSKITINFLLGFVFYIILCILFKCIDKVVIIKYIIKRKS